MNPRDGKGARDVFEATAADYDSWYDSAEGRPLYESELECVKDVVPRPSMPLLEIGVGSGRFAMRFPGAIGVDLTTNLLRMARKRGVKAVKARGEALPFGDGVFGCVLAIATLCFVESPLDVLMEAARVLRDGGCAVIGFIPRDSPWGALYEEKKRKGHPVYRHARFYTLDELKAFLTDAGFSVERVKSTLLRRPDEERRTEEPLEGYVRGAGFVCVEAVKTRGGL
ncbi:MAG: class I SAM-dependent methyltransferase [Deltaproteobacteria bacterium]|nr:class I SAM-dependent methyltransferase [Deltaproteobacteria bacterium]